MMAQDKLTEVRGLSAARVACTDCSVFQLCLPLGISEADLARLDGIIHRRRPLEPEQHLYRVGEAFHSIYVVRSGAVKTYISTPAGGEQVTGFHLPGEIVGLDAGRFWPRLKEVVKGVFKGPVSDFSSSLSWKVCSLPLITTKPSFT